MGKRKRATRRTPKRSSLVGRAVSAGRRALKEAESRVPPDLRRRVDRGIKDADKNARAAIKALQTQVRRASTRADVNSVLKRIDNLTKQARQIVRETGPRKGTSRARAASATRRTTRRTTSRPASRTRKPASTTRRAATRTTTARRSASTATPPRRRAAARRPRQTETVYPVVAETPMGPEIVGEIDVIEVSEDT